VETPGYYRDVPSGQIFIEFPKGIKAGAGGKFATRFGELPKPAPPQDNDFVSAGRWVHTNRTARRNRYYCHSRGNAFASAGQGQATGTQSQLPEQPASDRHRDETVCR